LGNKLSNIEIKKDCINLVLSTSFAIISYIFLAKIISSFYKPNISLILERAGTLLIPGIINYCKPEPLEKTIFIAGIFLIPVLLFAYYLTFKRLRVECHDLLAHFSVYDVVALNT